MSSHNAPVGAGRLSTRRRSIINIVGRYRTLILLVVAGACGLLAAVGARSYISDRLAIEQQRLNPERKMMEVVVAKHDLSSGTSVDASTMAVRVMPAEFVPGGVIVPESFEHAIGARLGRPMRSGEPLLPGALDHTMEGSFSSRIRQGIRAMTIQVDEVNSVSGMLQPGDRIDLLFSVRPPTGAGAQRQDEITAPLMQDLAVLATGSRVVPSGEPAGAGRPFSSITVEVSPEQAQRLIVAQRNGRLTATLRHPDDRSPVRASTLDVATLLGMRAAPPPRTVRAGPRGPEVYVGGTGAPMRSSVPSASAEVQVLAGARRDPADPLQPDPAAPRLASAGAQ